MEELELSGHYNLLKLPVKRYRVKWKWIWISGKYIFQTTEKEFLKCIICMLREERKWNHIKSSIKITNVEKEWETKIVTKHGKQIENKNVVNINPSQ